MTLRGVKPEHLLRPEVLALSAYHVPDSAGYIKLDAMENPYSWPAEMVDEWLKVIRQAKPNRYPDPAAVGLKQALKTAGRVPEQAEIMLGNGSDELIQIILMAVAGRQASVLAPEPTFVMYRQLALSLGLQFVGVSLNSEDFSLDMAAMRQAIREYQPAVIFLAYPNNPTGNVFSQQDVLEIIAMAPGLVVLDEAYAPFTATSFMASLEQFDHLLVMRTLSKLGLAGLRLGYLAGHTQWIGQLEKLRLPYNINVLTQLSVEFALARPEVFAGQVEQIRQERDWLLATLSAMDEIEVFPSETNFVLLRLRQHDATQVFSSLIDNGVLIKNLHPVGGLLSQCLRVTVGTHEENMRFVAAFSDILHA